MIFNDLRSALSVALPMCRLAPRRHLIRPCQTIR